MRALAAPARAFLAALIAALALSCTIDSRPQTSGLDAVVESGQAPPLRWSMEKWRDAMEEVEMATSAPRGDTRIARCTAFLEKYPDYPYADEVVLALVNAKIDKGNLDFSELHGWLQRLTYGNHASGLAPDYLLESYYLKYGFPVEMAERVARQARECLATDLKEIDSEPSPKRREQALREWQVRQSGLSLSEARILLRRRDYEGALRRLQELEREDSRVGDLSLALIDPRGQVAGWLPKGSLVSDRFNLSFAIALARSGRRDQAAARLDRVRDFTRDPEIGREAEALRKEIGSTARTSREIRAAPAPATDFHLKDLQGREVALSDFRGRVVLVMFWSTW